MTRRVRAGVPHSVGFAVDNSGVHVDATGTTVHLHRPSTRRPRLGTLSSTALTLTEARCFGGRPPLSPVSTAAMTTDENFSSMTDNDQNDRLVDSGDNHRRDRSLHGGTQ